MTLQELRQQAEKTVQRDYDAWATLSGAEREALIFKAMLRILEETDSLTFASKLYVAREAWSTGAWGWGGDESFAAFLCDVGGRYRNDNGYPSGTAYDMAGFVAIVWPALESQGHDPVGIAVNNWSKARLMVATVKRATRLVSPSGDEVSRPELAAEVQVTDAGEIERVVALAMNQEVSKRDMQEEVYVPRIPPWDAEARLQSDGTWRVSMSLTDQQFSLLQRLARGHMECRLV